MMPSLVPPWMRWTLTAALSLCSVAWAQTDPALSASPKSTTLGASGAKDFQSQVQQDVANGLYSAAQGQQLISNYEAAQARFDASVNQAASNFTKDVSLTMSSDQSQIMISQAQSATGPNGQTQLGGTAEQVNEQANAAYTAQLQAIRMNIDLQQAVQPVVQDSLNDLNSVVAQRASLISANPNVPAEQKFYAQQEANKVQLAAESTANQAMSADIAKLQAAEAYYENNKAQITQQMAAKIDSMVSQYGPDPSQWPSQNSAGSQAAAPSPPTVAQDQTATTPPAASPPAASAPYVTPTKGTVPSNAPDPAFNAYRNQPGGVAPTSAANDAGAAAGAAAAAAAFSAGPDPAAQVSANAQQNPPTPSAVAAGVAAGAAAAAAFANSAASNPPASNNTPTPLTPEQLMLKMEQDALKNWPAGAAGGGLVEGDLLGNSNFSGVLPDVPVLEVIQSFEYGDTVSVAALQPIYAGYNLSDNTGAAMMSLNLQVPVPSAVMTVPSMQVTGMPSDVMSSLDLQPALCGN